MEVAYSCSWGHASLPLPGILRPMPEISRSVPWKCQDCPGHRKGCHTGVTVSASKPKHAPFHPLPLEGHRPVRALISDSYRRIKFGKGGLTLDFGVLSPPFQEQPLPRLTCICEPFEELRSQLYVVEFLPGRTGNDREPLHWNGLFAFQ